MKVKYGINYVQLSMTMCVKIIKTAKRETEECEEKRRKQTQIYIKWEKNCGLFSAFALVRVWVRSCSDLVWLSHLPSSWTSSHLWATFWVRLSVCVGLWMNLYLFVCVCVCCVVIQSAINHAYAVRAVCLLDLMSMRLLFSVWFFSLSFFVLFLSFCLVRSRLFCTLKPL